MGFFSEYFEIVDPFKYVKVLNFVNVNYLMGVIKFYNDLKPCWSQWFSSPEVVNPFKFYINFVKANYLMGVLKFYNDLKLCGLNGFLA